MAFNRDSTLDISLGSGGWGGGASDGTTLWFGDSTSDFARAYVAATQARDDAKDINLGTSGVDWLGLSDGTTLWFLTPRQTLRGPTWLRPGRGMQTRI